MINNHIGFIFNFPIRVGGFALIFIGLVITMSMGWAIPVGILLAIAGAYFGLTSTGIDIDTDAKAIRHYTRYFGVKSGRWNEYPTYPNVCVISKERKQKRFREEHSEEPENPYQYEVYLVSRSHRGKVLMQILYNKEKANQAAKRYAQAMQAEVVEYEPPGRAKSRKRHGGHHHRHQSSHSKD